MKKIWFLSFSALAFTISSCNDDDTPGLDPITTESVYVVNAGVFPGGIGTITDYSPNSSAVNHNIFQKANLASVGAVANSIMVDDENGRIALVVSADAVTYIVNSDTYLIEQKIESLSSPRYVLKVSDNRYWISDWGTNTVHVVNPINGRTAKELPAGYGPERMLYHEGKVFITNHGGFQNGALTLDSTVTVYDVGADTIMATIHVGVQPNSLTLDKNGKLWVLSEGFEDTDEPNKNIHGYLHGINVDSLWVEDSIKMPDSTWRPNQIYYSEVKDQFYFLDDVEVGDIMMLPNGDTIVSETPFVDGNFYSLGFDPVLYQIYAGEHNDNSPAHVSRYNEDATRVQRFEVGQNPVDFGFKKNR